MTLNLNDHLNRHPSTQHMVKMLLPNPNLKGEYAFVPHMIANLAEDMLDNFADSPELTAGLRKLLEAKDCLVRCAVLGDDAVDYRDR